MQGDVVSKASVALGYLLALGFIAAGVIGWIADVTGGGSDLAFWLVLLVGGGLLILLGMLKFTSPPALSIGLVAAGALAGSLALFWSVIVPILAIALVALMIVRARRGDVAPAS